jgi:hypothetical protein
LQPKGYFAAQQLNLRLQFLKSQQPFTQRQQSTRDSAPPPPCIHLAQGEPEFRLMFPNPAKSWRNRRIPLVLLGLAFDLPGRNPATIVDRRVYEVLGNLIGRGQFSANSFARLSTLSAQAFIAHWRLK